MGTTTPPLWRRLLKNALLLGIFLGIPLGMSTDWFLRRLYEKAYTEQWVRAPAITYYCAGFYGLTCRTERAADTYELFVTRWPEDELLPDAVYQCALAWKDMGDDLEYRAHGNPEMRARRAELRDRAEQWLYWLARTYPTHPLRFIAERTASNLHNGY